MGRVLLGLEARLMAVARRLVRNPEAAAAREDRARVVHALASPPAEERSLLTAAALEGRAHAVLADEIGLSPGAVKSRAFRARRRLAAELETT